MQHDPFSQLDSLLRLIDARLAALRAAHDTDYADAWWAAKRNDKAAADCLRRAADYAMVIEANARRMVK